MKVYWDSSAIIFFYPRGRIAEISGITRPHSLAESFSALTGGGFEVVLRDGARRHKRLSPGLAAAVIAKIHPLLTYVDLTADEIVEALKGKKAQGGRVHDLLHAVAAEKAKADELWTLDENDFVGLGAVPLKYLSDQARS
ncbi:MAG: hypothetical protein QOJ40_2170 [Verrucomicrobiota bacterium]